MNKVIYEYPITDTLNSKVNDTALRIEIKASVITGFIDCKTIGLKDVQLSFEAELSTAHKTVLEAIIAAHTGEAAQVDESFVEARELRIREMTEQAILHPNLDPLDTEAYLIELDNYLNAWKRSGRNTILINKLVTDSANASHPQYSFLNEIVNEAGNKTFEYFIASVS